MNGLTKQDLERAFEAWEKGFRVRPEAYRTADECLYLSVSQVSAERADYMFELLSIQRQAAGVL
jgi:hypothetical protein